MRLAVALAAICVCGLLLRGLAGGRPAVDPAGAPAEEGSARPVRKPVRILLNVEATAPIVSFSLGEAGTSLFEWSGSDRQINGEFEIPARDGSAELILRALSSPEDKSGAKALRVWTSVLGQPGNETILWLLPGESEFVGVLTLRISPEP